MHINTDGIKAIDFRTVRLLILHIVNVMYDIINLSIALCLNYFQSTGTTSVINYPFDFFHFVFKQLFIKH